MSPFPDKLRDSGRSCSKQAGYKILFVLHHSKPPIVKFPYCTRDKVIFFLMLIDAYFMLVLLPDQTWPHVLGPYSFDEHHETLEFLLRRNYDVSSCELLPLPQPK